MLDWIDWRVIRLGAWLIALVVAVGMRLAGHSWRVAAAAWFLAVPPTQTVLVFLDSVSVLADPNSILRAIPARGLSRLFSRSILADMGYAGAGLLLLAAPRLGTASPRRLAVWLRDHAWPTGSRSEASSAWAGFLLFPALLLASWLVNVFLYGNAPALQNGDESSIWANMTLYHVILISLAAGVGEEIWYRGIYQTLLGRIMPLWAAIGVQAVVFGFAHSGYGTWAHVIGPALFGVVAGVVAWRFGLWAAIVLHTLVDVMAFGFEATDNQPWVLPLLTALLIVNVAVSATWLARETWRRLGPAAARPS